MYRDRWKNANGESVANKDLIDQAIDLEGRITRKGFVRVTWVPRKANRHADWTVKQALKEV